MGPLIPLSPSPAAGDETLDWPSSSSSAADEPSPEKMSHFGRSGPPDIRDTFSLLVLNITFRTTADDLYPLFDKCGKVVDVFIPKDRRTGDSRGFAFVRYKYAEEAQKAVEKLDGRFVDGREIMVQFAKYGPNAEPIKKGKVIEVFTKSRGRSRSHSPRRYRDDYRGRDRRRSRSRSRDRYDRDRDRYGDRDRYRGRDRDYRQRSRSRSLSPHYERGCGRDEGRRRSRSRSVDSRSPVRRSLTPRRSPAPARTPPSREVSPDGRSPPPRSVSPCDRRAHSRSVSPLNSDAED